MRKLLPSVVLLVAALSPAAGGRVHNAARDGDFEVFKKLERAHTNVHEFLNDKEDRTGQTPVMAATLAGKAEMVDQLLTMGADVSITEKDGYTPMHGAAFQGRAEVARVLIKHGVQAHDVHTDGFTPLHRTVWGRQAQHIETAKVLVKEGGADIDFRTLQGHSATIMAAEMPWIEMLEELLKMGADPNIKNKRGDPLLHIAVRVQNPKVVRAVLSAGADVTQMDAKGRNARKISKQLRSNEVMDLMIEATKKASPSPAKATDDEL